MWNNFDNVCVYDFILLFTGGVFRFFLRKDREYT